MTTEEQSVIDAARKYVGYCTSKSRTWPHAVDEFHALVGSVAALDKPRWRTWGGPDGLHGGSATDAPRGEWVDQGSERHIVNCYQGGKVDPLLAKRIVDLLNEHGI